MTWGIAGVDMPTALKLGPAENTFLSESARDSYFTAHPSNFAAYTSNPNNLIRITTGGNTSYQSYYNGSWMDYTPVVQGLPGEIASLDGVPVGQVPYKLADGTFGGSRLRMLSDGSLLAPPNFGVESGSIKFGDVITLSESAGFLAIQDHIDGNTYTLLDYATPRDAPSSNPRAFILTEAERTFLAQPVQSTQMSSSPLDFTYSVQNTARTNALSWKTFAAMSNVRIRISQKSNDVALKYLPSKEAWETELGGLEWGVGDVTFDFNDTPVILIAGDILRFEIYASSISLLGNGTIPYISATIQAGILRNIVTESDYTASDVVAKISSLSGTNRLSMGSVRDGVSSVAGRIGDVVLTAQDVSGLASVAVSGAYSDLSGRPAIPTLVSQLSNDTGYLTNAPVTSVNGKIGDVVLVKADVGLDKVDNTADNQKTVSPAQQTAIDTKMSLHVSATNPHPQYSTPDQAAASAPVQSVNGQTGAVVLNTGSLTESGNLYYTDSRVANYLSANAYNVRTTSSVGTGASVVQGTTTGDSKFRSVLGAGSVSVVQNANEIVISAPASSITSVNGQTGVVSLTSTNVPEGSNLYYTDTRVSAYLANNGYGLKSASSVGTGISLISSNVSGAVGFRSILGTGAVSVSQSSNEITISAPSAPVSSVNGLTGSVLLNTSNVGESTNLYYTDARVTAYLTNTGYTVKSVASTGTGSSLVKGTASGISSIKSLTAGRGISLTANTDDVNIGSTAFPLIYNATGSVASPKIWCGTITSDANGEFSVNYSSAGFTSTPVVQVTAVLTTTVIADRTWATLSGVTNTGATGYTVRGITLLLLATTLRVAPSTVVHVMAIGT